eukprot:gene7780-637_t
MLRYPFFQSHLLEDRQKAEVELKQVPVTGVDHQSHRRWVAETELPTPLTLDALVLASDQDYPSRYQTEFHPTSSILPPSQITTLIPPLLYSLCPNPTAGIGRAYTQEGAAQTPGPCHNTQKTTLPPHRGMRGSAQTLCCSSVAARTAAGPSLDINHQSECEPVPSCQCF